MKKSIKRNAVLNVIRQLCSLIFPLITFPYVSRVLGAENYGKINFSQSVVSYFILLAALGISNYAIREGASKRNNQASLEKFASQIFSINICSAIISYLGLIILLFFSDKLHNYSVIIIMQSMIMIFNVLGVEWIYSIFEDYLYITIRSILVQIFSLVLVFLLVKTSEDYLYYSFVLVFSSSAANIINYFHAKKYVRIRPTLVLELKKHLLPMLVLFFNSLAITIYVNSDMTILGFLKGDYDVGIYSLSVKIYSIVKNLINSCIIVTLPRLSLYIGQKKIQQYNDLLSKVLKALLLILTPILIGMFSLSRQIVVIIGGKNYIGASGSLKALSIALIFSILASFFTTSVLLPNKMEKYNLKYTIISAFVNLVLNFALIPQLGIYGAAMTTAFAEFIVFILSYKKGRTLCSLSGIKNTLFTCLIGGIFVGGGCFLVNKSFNEPLNAIATAIPMCILLYGCAMVITKNEIFFDIVKEIKKKIRK